MRQQKSVYYKRAEFTNLTVFDLAQGFESLKKKKLSAVARAEVDSWQQNKYRMITKFVNRNGCWCGVLVDFTSGNGVPILNWDSTAEEIDVESAPPPKSEKGKTDYVDGLLYFVVMGSHVVFIPSLSATSRSFERHLNFIFSTHVKLLQGENELILNDRITQNIPLRDIRLVEFSSPIVKNKAGKTDSKGKSNVSEDKVRVTSSKVKRIIDVLFDNNIKKLQGMESALEEGNVDLVVGIKVKGQMEENGNKAVNSLAASLRHLDQDDNVKIVGKRGTKFESKNYKLSDKISIESNDGQLVQIDAWDSMIKWLKDSINNKLIPK